MPLNMASFRKNTLTLFQERVADPHPQDNAGHVLRDSEEALLRDFFVHQSQNRTLEDQHCLECFKTQALRTMSNDADNDERMEFVKYDESPPQNATAWVSQEHHEENTMRLEAASSSASEVPTVTAQLNSVNIGPPRLLHQSEKFRCRWS